MNGAEILICMMKNLLATYKCNILHGRNLVIVFMFISYKLKESVGLH